MATRSFIAQKLINGTFQAIYCHWDGYPENNGLLLFKHYRTDDAVAGILALGSLSSLGDSRESCEAYHRDKGEKYAPPSVYPTLAALQEACQEANGEYLYIWADGAWTCNGKPLAGLLAEAGLIQAEAAGPVAGGAVDWAVLGPKLAEVLFGIFYASEAPSGAALGEARLCRHFRDQARDVLSKAGRI